MSKTIRSLHFLAAVFFVFLGAFFFFLFPHLTKGAPDTTTGLVGHWTFDDGSGTEVADSSGNGYTGDFLGDPTWVTGKIGGALEFDGIDDAIEINQNILPAGDAFSVSLWATFVDDDSPHVLISHDYSTRDGEIAVITYQSNFDRLVVDDYKISGFVKSPQSFDSEWHHIVWNSDASGNSKLYIDGLEQVNLSNQGGGTSSLAKRFYIGTRNAVYMSDPYKGMIDDVRVYTRNLTAEDIIALYEDGSGEDLVLPSTPTFSHPSGSYSDSFSLTISADSGDSIYYTADGTTPTIDSSEYSGSILISNTATITASAFDGLFSSTTVGIYDFDGGGAEELVADPDAVLPQDLDYQISLRNWMETLDDDDFAVTLGEFTWEDGFATTSDDVFKVFTAFGRNGIELGNTSGLRMAAEDFTLDNIEADDQINLHVDGSISDSADPLGMTFYATWDYPGNPFGPGTSNSDALKMRSLVAGAVDMIMHEDYYGPDGGRSDFMGGTLIPIAYAYYHGKDLLSNDAQQAYETGLRRVFSQLEDKSPSGTGGKNMETFQLVSMWYVAAAIGDADLMTQWKARSDYVLEYITDEFDGYAHEHGACCADSSYDGIMHYFITWAGALSEDAEILSIVTKMNKLKGEQTFPEPTIPDSTYWDASSPSHFNVATNLGYVNDQWSTTYRDISTGLLLDSNALYLNAMRKNNILSDPTTLKTEAEMRSEMPTLINRANSKYDPDELSGVTPGVWETEEHWISFANYLPEVYTDGLYDTLSGYYEDDNQLLLPPVRRTSNYVNIYDDDFLTFKFDDFAGSLHVGNVPETWGGNLSGLSGGALSEFWTPDSGSVIQGRSRGSQNGSDADFWTGDNGPLGWSSHAITGVGDGGGIFSTARNIIPTRSLSASGGNQATVTVSGTIGSDATDPSNEIAGTANYAREFVVDEDGVQITSSLTSSSGDSVDELWEILPLFVSHENQADSEEAQMVISFNQNGEWITASTSMTFGVTSVRMSRFGEPVYINFENPEQVKIASTTWDIDNGVYTNLYIDLLGESTTLPNNTSVEYVISVTAPVTSPEPNGDSSASVLTEDLIDSTGEISDTDNIDDAEEEESTEEDLIVAEEDEDENESSEGNSDNQESDAGQGGELSSPGTSSFVLGHDNCSFYRSLMLESTGGDVECLQQFLKRMTHFGSQYSITGYFGKVTEGAVMSWQADRKIPVDGIFGPLSMTYYLQQLMYEEGDGSEQPVLAPANTLSPKEMSVEVYKLQRLLNNDPDTRLVDGEVFGSPGKETLFYGALTEAAVKRFQIKYGIFDEDSEDESDFGVVNQATLEKMIELYSLVIPEG